MDQPRNIEDTWERAFLTVLGEAIADLQALIFEEGWDTLVAQAGGTEPALRESVRYFERGLAHLFGFVRAAGVPESPVAWSALKANLRRSALEAGQEITLRTALDSALYAAEQIPLGDHTRYHDYVSVLTSLLQRRAANAEPIPKRTMLEDRLEWAYALLSDLEDHAAFHDAVAEEAARLDQSAAVDLEERLLRLQRFDLILSTCLLWLAESAGPANTR
jgi:hypothetical protein